jgi:protein involved in polysaccharide export with SLBB domain
MKALSQDRDRGGAARLIRLGLAVTNTVVFALLLASWGFAEFEAKAADEKPPATAGTSAPSSLGSAAAGAALEPTNSLKAAAINSMDMLDEKHKLAVGDRLSFRIVEDEEEPKVLVVTDSGEVELPYIGRLAAVDKTCKEFARAIKAELEKDYYYQATVIVAVDVMTKSRGKVYLVGSVRVPGPQEIPSDEVFTATKAILRAGGFTEFANKKNVTVTRKADHPGSEDRKYTINAQEILEKSKTDRDLTLEPGDLIFVPDRGVHIY